ncbi:HD-GYP domain-containing protein [Amphibacillus sp. Q70]|uniref:HD-GYP domain-containing protein n=1 Tax=Amphibacillus sp. Q70 TaxID=3453416 RepID=UPI003F84F0EB
MRLVPTRELTEGKELAKPIYNDQGKVLVQSEVTLTRPVINRLLELGVTFVYVKDELSDDIVIHSSISEQVRFEAIQTVKSFFYSFENNGIKNKAFLFDKTTEKMSGLVDLLVSQIQEDDQVLTLMSDIFISDDYLFEHSVNVAIYSIALANELHFSQKEVKEIGLGAILHDIGKVFLPDVILKKNSQLTPEEFETIKTHPELGFEFLRKSDFSLLVAHCAYQHHERLNGSGYPRGIKEDDIHKFGKVLAITDVFDAVTSDRIYREAMLPQEGLEILYAGSGTLFDQEMIRTFRESITVYPNGVTIELNNGCRAIVVRQNKQLYNRPVVRVISYQNKVITPYDLDLADHLNITVTGYGL